ncbi:MAG: camphor resistance protein CrcB [Gemmatimonadetes bacterium]|nr:camphor resistance protein CrcB [Gemmatimonadota bacterium]
MIWLVALGGALGSVSRFLLGPALQRAFNATFPVGTLFINILGSLILGFIMRLTVEGVNVTPEARAFIAIGFCGGFTTFSTFSYEAMRLLEDGEGSRAALYILASVLLSLGAAFVGLVAARELLALRR